MNMDINLQYILQGNNELAAHLCRQIFTKGTTTILSPIGIHATLTLLSRDPWFFNKEIFNYSLNIDVNKAIECYIQILAFLSSADSRKLVVANIAIIKDNYQLEIDFETILLDNFFYELNSLNFNESDTAAQSINYWVEDATYNKTNNLVNSGNISDKTRLILLNTMYFNDKWAIPFAECTPGTFHINDVDIVQVEMMKVKSDFFYKEMYNYKILQLPFVDNEYSLIIILPSQEFSKFGMTGSFQLYDIPNFINNMSLEEVEVSLPKFKLEETVDLKNYISEMGLESVFSANLNNVIHGEEINLEEIQQKVFIDVNWDGSEASSGISCSLNKTGEKKIEPKNGILVYQMDINTNISNHFAKTVVEWKTKNVEKCAREVTFDIMLSETAFITGFVMEIDGVRYTSYITEKNEAKTMYNQDVTQGQRGVEAKTTDSKEVSVSINLAPESAATFNLTYEEMLERVYDQYELVLNIYPGHIIDNLNVQVIIMETRPLKFVNTPPLRSGNKIRSSEYNKYLDPLSSIQMINAKTAVVKFSPTPKRQICLAHYLEGEPSDGLAGQFVVQYDVERDPENGEVLLRDGYFVHFFAPNDLDPLPMHIVFVLNTSTSMRGTKIIQLKDAMVSILDEIRKNDIISIIEFNNDIMVWDINSQQCTVVRVLQHGEDFRDPFNKLGRMSLPDPTYANEDTLIKAKNIIQNMEAFGNARMIGGLETALYIANTALNKAVNENEKHHPIIVFLTDGEPNVHHHVTNRMVIIVTRINLNNDKVPIFSLSFGLGADRHFLKTLSSMNQGFSRHIYEAEDASLQLQQFCKRISSPLLSNVHIKYNSEVYAVIRTYFPIYFGGSEVVVTGRYRGPFFPATIKCWGPRGPKIITSTVEHSVSSPERLWAFLMVKQLLEIRGLFDDKTRLSRLPPLALQYSFVTDVTSLVVVKPKDTNCVKPNRNNISPAGKRSPVSNGSGETETRTFEIGATGFRSFVIKLHGSSSSGNQVSSAPVPLFGIRSSSVF